MAKKLQKSEIQICNPAEWLDKSQVDSYLEPVVKGTLIAPNEYQSAITSLCEECRGEPVGFEMIDQNRFKVRWSWPVFM